MPLIITDIKDDNGTPADSEDDFNPMPVEVLGFNVGDLNMNGLLDETESWRYEAMRIATAGQYTNIATVIADVDGDGRNDTVTTPSREAVETKVFRNMFGVEDDPIQDEPYRQFFAFGPDFISGSVVALADMNSDGLADVVVGNAGGMRSTVRVFDVSGTPTIINTFLPFGDSSRGGVSIDLGDIDGDGVPDLIAGAGCRGESATASLIGSLLPRDRTGKPMKSAVSTCFSATTTS